MAGKTKGTEALAEAIAKQAANLDPAQREFVLSQFRTYEWNADRISSYEKQLEDGVVDEEGRHNYDAESKLFKQRHQLVAEQSQLFTHIMRWLKGTMVEESDLDDFLKS